MARVNRVPSRWLLAFARGTRWALWILASAWITLGLLWGGLHFLIVPRIGEFRPWLEQQASQRMGIGVRIGDMLATSNGLIPSVELRDVRLLDADGREALRLPSVLAALSVYTDAEMCRWPPYASRVVFEVWQHSSKTVQNVLADSFIRVIFNGIDVTSRIPACVSEGNKGMCSLGSFSLQVKSLLGGQGTMKEACKV